MYALSASSDFGKLSAGIIDDIVRRIVYEIDMLIVRAEDVVPGVSRPREADQTLNRAGPRKKRP